MNLLQLEFQNFLKKGRKICLFQTGYSHLFEYTCRLQDVEPLQLLFDLYTLPCKLDSLILKQLEFPQINRKFHEFPSHKIS